jgi:hypothetical protein
VVVDASLDPARVYFGSPGITRLDDGTWLVSHDWFGPGTGNNEVSVLASTDGGASWQLRAKVPGLFWPSLFQHGGALYLLGNDGEYGDVVLRRSTDAGHTWTTATGPRTGRLRVGRAHSGPMPMVEYEGRLWGGMEAVIGDGGWPAHFAAMVMSAPVEADLLDAAAWTFSEPLPFDPAWLSGERPGWLEGNVVVRPEGGLGILLRTHAAPGVNDPFELTGSAAAILRWELGALARVSADGREVEFDPARDWVHLPGSQSKFTVRHDPVSGRYWSLVQKITNPHTGYGWQDSPYHQRNVLMLISSADLRTWTEEAIVLRYREGRMFQALSPVGFQYADWVFDGDDLAVAVRTGWGAVNYHDANYITYHRVSDFRRARERPPPPDLGES